MKIICDDTDQAVWLAERRCRITASDMLVFLGKAPDWWSTSKDELIGHKLEGTEPVFDQKATVRMKHGRLDEAANLKKAGQLLGFPVAPYHYLVSNDRWPYLGATLDGLLFPQMGWGPDLDLTNQVGQVGETSELIGEIGDAMLVPPLLLEMKQTEAHRYGKTSKPWIDFVPDYYKPQVQTGLWLTDLEHCVLVGCLGAADMTAWLLRRDPEWEHVMDEANDEAKALLGGLEA